MTPPPSFSTSPQIPNNTTVERSPMITTVFATTTPENTLFAYCASTSTNPNPMISPTFVEANYEVLESLLTEQQRQIRFKEAPNREGSRRGRNAEGIRPSEIKDENSGANLPPLLVAHLGRNESGKPLWSSLTSVQGGHQTLTNMGGISLLTAHIGNPPTGGIFAYHPQGGKALKDQENPIGTITVDRKIEIGFPHTEDLATDCFPPCPKSQERSSTQKRKLESSNNLLVCLEADGPETKLREKDATPVEAPVLMIRREGYNPRKRPVEGNNSKVMEITFPPLRNISSADPVIINAYVSGRQVNRVYLDGGTSCQYNPKEPKEEQRATSEEHQEEVKEILSCVDSGEG
nr:hypothetical protein [Tanacetum cinerariifolium]